MDCLKCNGVYPTIAQKLAWFYIVCVKPGGPLFHFTKTSKTAHAGTICPVSCKVPEEGVFGVKVYLGFSVARHKHPARRPGHRQWHANLDRRGWKTASFMRRGLGQHGQDLVPGTRQPQRMRSRTFCSKMNTSSTARSAREKNMEPRV